jgi:DNA repair protein RadC
MKRTYRAMPETHAAIIAAALNILEEQAARYGCNDVLGSPTSVKDFLRLRHMGKEYEVFDVLFLSAQNRLIAAEEMFRGTLTQTSVYPREVVKRALALNAAAVIFSHNHPSGVAEPSAADRLLTDALRNALNLVDVRVLDHIITAGASTLSFAERGLL